MTHPEQTAASGRHTPGPWRVYVPRDASDAVVSGPASWRREGAEIADLVRVRRHAPNLPGFQQEQEANARLIAAAPDMLDAGRSMVAAFDPDAMNPEQYNAWSDLSAAISRAEGRTEPKAGE